MGDLFLPKAISSSDPICRSRSCFLEPAGDLRAAVRYVVEQARAFATGGPLAWERRAEVRDSFTIPLMVTPAAAHGEFHLGSSIPAIGKNISSRGVGFFTCEPIATRWILLWLRTGPTRLVPVRAELRWCRRSSIGWLEHGGYLISVWGDCHWDPAALRATAQEYWSRRLKGEQNQRLP